MSRLRFVAVLACSLSLLGCDGGDGGDEGAAGQLGQACIGGSFCNDGLVCSAGVCMGGGDEAGDSSGSESGDSSGSESGSTTTTDTGTPEFGLYGGYCANSDECTGELWCTDEGRSWCTMDCTSDADCPTDPNASALPRCEYLDEVAGLMQRQGCVLECLDESECPVGAQCFYSGLASKNWCGFLP